MNDPVWDRVHQLCEGYPPEFNAAAVYDVVLAAWKMGFDVIKAPEGSSLYADAIKTQYEAERNFAETYRLQSETKQGGVNAGNEAHAERRSASETGDLK